MLDLVERIRALSRAGATGGDAARRSRDARRGAAARAPGASSCARSRLYFQLANIAEQHHRLRRRRELRARGPRPARVARRRVRAARRAGSRRRSCARDGRARLASSSSDGPPDRGDAAHRPARASADRRAAARAGRPELPPSRRARLEDALAEEMTILWQTDEVRSRAAAGRRRDPARPLVLRAEPLARPRRRCCASTARRAGRAAAARFGTWIGGDLDGNPNVGAETVEAALEQARGARRAGCYARRGARARAPLGHLLASRRRVDAGASSASCSASRSGRGTTTSRTAASSPGSGSGSATTTTHRPRSCWPSSTLIDAQPARRTAAAAIADGGLAALRTPRRAVRLPRREARPARARERGPRARRARCSRRSRAAARVAAPARHAGARHADRLDDRRRPRTSLAAEALARERARRARRAAARDDRRPRAPRAATRRGAARPSARATGSR